VLYVAPVLLIVAGRVRGCRPEERRLVALIASVATVAFAPAVVVGVLTAAPLIKGCAYALVVVAGIHWAMLMGARPGREDPSGDGDDDGPGDGGGDEPISPFDWDDFERRFWDEVRRRDRDRIPV
jgi:hypothetical protein